MDEKERRILLAWARDEEAFLDEVIGRVQLHKRHLQGRIEKLLRKRK